MCPVLLSDLSGSQGGYVYQIDILELLSGRIHNLLSIKYPLLQIHDLLLKLRPLVRVHGLHSTDLAY